MPAWSGHGLGASEATSPKLEATARIVSRVGGLEHREVHHRELLLAVPELDVILLELDRLRLERCDHCVRDLLRRRHPHG